MVQNYQFRWQQFAHRLMDDLLQHPERRLPGIQELGKQYGVSRPTVERAFLHLEELGVLSPAQPGRKRQVDLSKLQKIAGLQGRASTRILFLSTDPESNPAYMTRVIYEGFHRLCDQEALFLSYMQVPPEPSELRALLSTLQPRGVILYLVSATVSESVFALNIPAIEIGGESSYQYPYFVTPYADLLIQAFQQAQAVGHRRITIPMGNSKSPIYEGLATKLEKHFSVDSFPFGRRYNFPLAQGTTVEDYHAMLRELFRYTPPTCIVLHDLDDYLMASSFFLKEGLRIPDDVSVILLSYDPALEKIDPSIAHFVLFTSDMTVQAFRVLQEQMNGFLSHERVELSPSWVPGGSLTPPK